MADRAARSNPFMALFWSLTVLFVLLLLGAGTYQFRSMREAARSASCLNDVYNLREAVVAYARDHDGLIPPMSETRGNIMAEAEGFYPKYLANSCWLQCEFSKNRRKAGTAQKNNDLGISAFNDDSFFYLPWAVTNEAEGLAFVTRYYETDLDAQKGSLSVTLNGRQHALPRVRLSPSVLSRTIDENSAPVVPIAVEWPDKFHKGGTVLYANGWIVNMSMGEGFPMTADFIAGMRDIAALDKQ